jgi:hypothetical protein
MVFQLVIQWSRDFEEAVVASSLEQFSETIAVLGDTGPLVRVAVGRFVPENGGYSYHEVVCDAFRLRRFIEASV